jgi:hypothetical protein
LEEGEAAAIVGTASMLNREPLDEENPDPFKPNQQREMNDGNWRIEGAEAGVVTDDDIYAVRLIATPPKPFTKPIRYWGSRAEYEEIKEYIASDRQLSVVARYGSEHGERWEILGEFPLAHTDTIDQQGNPDTSWAAKIPADTPFLIQTLDKNGMTAISELTWRGLKPGETRVDCGGCHAHSVEKLDYSSTQSGNRAPIQGIANMAVSDPMVQEGLWDLTKGEIPLLAEQGITKVPGQSYSVEFNRDVLPIINNNCIGCHTSGGSGEALILDGNTDETKPYTILTKSDASYSYPQRNKYIRIPQARQSLLTWVVWGERLDGRTNETRNNDVDYPESHPNLELSDSEKRTIARWIDLGSPIDFPDLNNEDFAGFRYTDDYQLPVINIHHPFSGVNTSNKAVIGFTDAMSGLNWDSLIISFYDVENASEVTFISEFARNDNGVVSFDMPGLSSQTDYVLKIEINDAYGNKNVESTRFTYQ